MNEKLHTLLVGKHTFRERVLESILPCLVLSFILFFFGPLDLAYVSRNYVSWYMTDILPECLKTWVVVFLILLAAVSIPGGKLHAWMVSFVTGFALAAYLQGAFLNPDLGTLDGTAVRWENYSAQVILGLAIWFFIIAAVFMLHYFSRSIWKKAVLLISLVLLIMQSVSLSVKLVEQSKRSSENYIRDVSEAYALAPGKNIIVILLDRTNNLYVNEMLEEYPEALDGFSDFTRFDNMASRYYATFPALAYLMTGHEYNFTGESYTDFFYNSWHGEKAAAFYNRLAEKGYKRNLYIGESYAALTLDNMEGITSNIVRDKNRTFNVDREAFSALLKLSFYRYLPLGMKAQYWIYTGNIEKMNSATETVDISEFRGYLQNGVQVLNNTEKLYAVYHTHGAHPPYRLNVAGKHVGDSSRNDTLAGMFALISGYLDEMKALGLYEDATIIISTDHGYPADDASVLFMVKRAGEHHDEMQIDHTPLSQTNYMATVAEAAGISDPLFGKSVFDPEAGNETERVFARRWPQAGHITHMREYRFSGGIDDLQEKIVNDDFKEYELVDCYY